MADLVQSHRAMCDTFALRLFVLREMYYLYHRDVDAKGMEIVGGYLAILSDGV